VFDGLRRLKLRILPNVIRLPLNIGFAAICGRLSAWAKTYLSTFFLLAIGGALSAVPFFPLSKHVLGQNLSRALAGFLRLNFRLNRH